MTSRIRGKGKTLRLERTKAREEFGLRGGGMALWALLIISAFLLFLCLEDCQALEDYEFHRVREAYQLRATVFQIDPQIPEYWEGGKEAEPEASATLAKALASRQGDLEGNPFYHLLLGETYFRRDDHQKAQDEWARASASAGDDPFVHWLLLRDFYRSGKTDPARKEMQQIEKILSGVGPKRLPFLASQCVQLAARLKDDHPPDFSLECIDLALHLDPRSTEAHYVKASLLWKQGILNIGNILKQIFSGSVLALRGEREASLLWANLLSALVMGYFVLFFVFGATLFLKYEPLLRHELKERMRITLSPLTRTLLLGFLYLLPIFLLLGWSWLLFFWIFLIFPYCLGREKAIVTLLIFLLFTLPFFYRYGASVQIAAVDPLIETVMQVEGGLQGEGAGDFLAQYVGEHPEDPLFRFYLGLALNGEWKFGAAGEEFRTYLERFPNHAAAHNNLGNIYFLEKRYEEAEDEYKKAIEADPQVASPHANLSLLYAYSPRQLRIEDSEAEFRKAEQLEPGITRRMESEEMPLKQRLIFQNLSRSEFWGRIFAPSNERDLLAEALWGERIRFLSLSALWLFPFIMALLLWVAFGLRSGGPNPRFCQRCGKDICEVCEKGSARVGSCSTCYAIFYSREAVNPQMRIERLLWKDRHGELQKLKVRLLSLFPGAASFYVGRSWSGLVQSAPFLLLLVYWSRWSEITPASSAFSQQFPFLWGALFLVPLLILYVTSLARGLRWSP